MSQIIRLLIVGLVGMLSIGGGVRLSRAETFLFGTIAGNNIHGLESGSITEGAFTMQMEAGPPGAQLHDVSIRFLGINSREIPDVIDHNIDKFDILGGTSPLAGAGESVQFSFDVPGVLTGIDFDGVKDESLEYFILESTGGTRINFFDSAANTTVPGAVDAAVTAGALSGDVFYLLEIPNGPDDEAQGLSIPFAAGQQFTITYAELGDEFHPLLEGNGARLQGITVQTLPEPGALPLALMGLFGLGLKRRVNRPFHRIG